MKIIVTKSGYSKIEPALEKLNFNIKPGERVLIKPNLVLPRDCKTGATTDLGIVETLIKYIKKKKAIPIIGESTGYEFDSQAFSILGLTKIIKKYDIEFVDFRNCKYKTIKTDYKIFKKITLPEVFFRVDKIINVPKLKTHMLTKVSMGMKNLMGCIPLKERRIVHLTGFDSALIELNKIIKSDLILVDASSIMHGKGPAFGDKINPNIYILGTNIFEVEDFCARLLGVEDRVNLIKKINKENLVGKYKVEGNYKNLSIVLPEEENYRRMYWMLYFLDHLQNKITKKTLIPWVMQNFGIKPIIDKNLCDGCVICKKVCPIGAIEIKNGKAVINYNKCKTVKCMKCYESCPKKAIKLKGISKPSKT